MAPVGKEPESAPEPRPTDDGEPQQRFVMLKIIVAVIFTVACGTAMAACIGSQM